MLGCSADCESRWRTAAAPKYKSRSKAAAAGGCGDDKLTMRSDVWKVVAWIRTAS